MFCILYALLMCEGRYMMEICPDTYSLLMGSINERDDCLFGEGSYFTSCPTNLKAIALRISYYKFKSNR